MSEEEVRTKKEAAKDIRDSVDFRTDMIKTQQEALVKTMKRYEQRDNPVEQAFETVTVKLVDAFLTANEKIVNALPNDTRLRIQKTWQDIMLAF
ncbi:MAG TPA: hypothetical protein VKM55_20530 [Candidatus Lokiarchaeia archaeon]|nr:hypothetical protein [Candidatus Lokiarchaeia archaeon]